MKISEVEPEKKIGISKVEFVCDLMDDSIPDVQNVFRRFRSWGMFTVTLRKLYSTKILVKTAVVPRKCYNYIIFSR